MRRSLQMPFYILLFILFKNNHFLIFRKRKIIALGFYRVVKSVKTLCSLLFAKFLRHCLWNGIQRNAFLATKEWK